MSTAPLPALDAAAYRPGLFVIWPAASGHRQQIIDDLYRRFDVLGLYEVEWTPSCAMRNFERFYSDLDVRGVYHVFNKGRGPLTLVLVRDRMPRVVVRATSRGERRVNDHFVSAKQAYREWTQGLEVHCSETPEEARRDAMMLLGADMDTCQAAPVVPATRHIEKVQRDVSGANGWASANELFSALNECARYAVLFERSRGRDELLATAQPTLQIMTEDFAALHRIVNAVPVIPAAPHGGEFEIFVGGRRCRLGIRFPGDGFFDPDWADAMLARRVYDHSGYFRLNNNDYFESLAYHVLAHRPVDTARPGELRAAAERLARVDWHPEVLDNPVRAAQWLDAMLRRHGYGYSRPLDPQVRCRRPLQEAAPVIEPAQILARSRRLTGPVLASWWRLRDHTLLQFPWLRQLRQRLHRRAARPTAASQ